MRWFVVAMMVGGCSGDGAAKKGTETVTGTSLDTATRPVSTGSTTDDTSKPFEWPATTTPEATNDRPPAPERPAFTLCTAERTMLSWSEHNPLPYDSERASWILNAAGHLQTTEYDEDIDGSIDRRFVRIYDTLGYLVRYDKDYRGDGVFFPTTYTYNVDGSMHSQETIGESIIWNYDAAGHLIRQTTDWGPYANSQVRLYTTDSEGRVLTEDVYAENGTDSLERTRFAYTSHTAESWEDAEPDGVDDHYQIERFRSDGLVVSKEVDTSFDGVVDWLTTYEYDDAGRPLLETTYFQGELANEVTYVWNCP